MAQKLIFKGEVAEWFKTHAWKACIEETLSRVRIPPSPPLKKPHFKRLIKRILILLRIINKQIFLKNDIILFSNI